MRIELKTEGGLAYFPGWPKPILIESTRLSEQEEKKLQQLLDAAKFFELPSFASTRQSASQGSADLRYYTLTIQDGTRQHTVQVSDPLEDQALQSLLNWIKAHKNVS